MKTMNELQQIITDVLGEIITLDKIAPGVYESVTKNSEERICFANNFYVVEEDSPVISQMAKTLGKPPTGQTTEGLLFYDVDEATSGKFVIEYEVAKYRQKNGLKKLSETTLREMSVFGMEHHPEYFGSYPVSSLTPWGYTTRHWTIENGIHWLETDECRTVLSLAYPYWECELTDSAKKLGMHVKSDLQKGVHFCFANMFFLEKDACVPIFELLEVRPNWCDQNIINRKALMNTLWQLHPEYAMSYNVQEQSGGHDILGLVMDSFGAEVSLQGSLQNMISITPGAGFDYLNLR